MSKNWQEIAKLNKKFTPEDAEAIMNGVDAEFKKRGIKPEVFEIGADQDNAALRAEVRRLKTALCVAIEYMETQGNTECKEIAAKIKEVLR